MDGLPSWNPNGAAFPVEGRRPPDMLDARALAFSHSWERHDLDDRSQLRARIIGGCSSHSAGEVRARTVMLAAGAYGSPGVLLRSGIGPERAFPSAKT